MGGGAAEGLWRHNNGRHLGHHLVIYQELEIRCKPQEMVIFCALSTLHYFSHKIFFYCWKKLKKTCIFTQKWLDHVLLMTSYLVTIATDHHLTCLKICARDDRCFIPYEKIKKNLMGVGILPPPLERARVKSKPKWTSMWKRIVSTKAIRINGVCLFTFSDRKDARLRFSLSTNTRLRFWLL